MNPLALLSRYVGRKVSLAIAMALLVIVGLDVVAEVIDELGDMRNDYQFRQVMEYVALTLPSQAYDYLPFSALIGCLVGLGILAGNSEIVVMRAAGVSLWRIMAMVIKPILWFVLAGMLVGELVTPYLDQLADGRRQLQRTGMQSSADNGGVWSVEGNEYIHINAVFPGGVVFGVTRYQFDVERQLQSASFSSRASYDRVRRHWVEENVAITRFVGRGGQSQTRTEKQVTRIWSSELTPALLQQNVLAPENLSMQSLFGYIKFLGQQQRDSGAYQLALWTKILQPLTVIGLVILAVAFVFGPLRESTMGLRIFVGVVTGIGFRILQDMLEPSSLVFGFSPLLAVALPIVLCFVIGARLLRRAA